jgi:hypothetical protein
MSEVGSLIAAGAIVVLGMAGASAQATDAIVAFQSPSGNAHCMIDTRPGPDRVVVCELREFTGKAPPKPGDCELDWVPGATLDGQGRVALFACQGDTIQTPDSPKLAYGKSLTHGEITCASAVTGITCNVKSGRGFLVSRAVIKRL